jgi:hypothetical protein
MKKLNIKIMNKLSYKMACKGTDRNYKPCRFTPNGYYCKHHTYLNEYTEQMLKDSRVCNSCKKWKFTGHYSSCESCRDRSEATRKESKESIVLCKKEGCKFKSSENEYCGKHQANHFKDETESMGLKVCKQYLRGCRSQNSMSYKFSACQDCLEKEREKDHKRRGTKIEAPSGQKSCSVCCKLYSLKSFQGLHGETKTCTECRAANKRADEKRVSEHVKELARKNAEKPERKAVKKAWKEANYEKVAKHWIDARSRLIENDLEGYLKKNAEHAKKWRDANPEKVKANNLAKINSMNSQFSVYKISAETKQLEFNLTKGDFIEIVENECYYCGIVQEKGFNGIDRLNSSEGYINSNCVSCCEMCNFMKGCLGPTIFINRIEHILTHLGLFQGKFHPEDFKDISKVEYSHYKCRANKKEFEFKLSKTEFNEKIKDPCYLCGKHTTETHKNGIDRFDNEKGYTLNNIKSCCGNCNYIKRNNQYDEMIDKCMKICVKKRKISNLTFTSIESIKSIENVVVKIENVKAESNTSIVKGTKQTKEEKAEKARIRKQNQRERQKQMYGDEEYKKMKAKEIADYRANKKN